MISTLAFHAVDPVSILAGGYLLIITFLFLIIFSIQPVSLKRFTWILIILRSSTYHIVFNVLHVCNLLCRGIQYLFLFIY